MILTILLIAARLSFAAATSDSAPLTTVLVTNGSLAVSTALTSEVLSRNDTRIIDSRGRVVKPARSVVRRLDPRKCRTTLVSCEGTVKVNGVIVRAGEALTSTGPPDRASMDSGPASIRAIELLSEFGVQWVESAHSPAIAREVSAQVSRVIAISAERLESLNIERALEYTWRSAMLSGRPFREYGEILNEIAPKLRDIDVSIALTDMTMKNDAECEAGFVASIDFIVNDPRRSVVNLAGSGRMRFKRYDRTWFIDGGDVTAYDVSSDELPTEFIRLRDMLVASRRVTIE